jgi:DNA-binding MarR family transcriptional regulator
MANGISYSETWTKVSALADASAQAAAPALREQGLTPAQFELLTLLESMRCGCCGEGECRCDESYLGQNDIGSRISCTKGNVSSLVQRLVEEGLVSREPNPRNRRENSVRITAAGRKRLHAAQPAVDAALAAIWGRFNEEETRDLFALLGRLGRGEAGGQT